ncbi:PP2C family protein-serine/threonine phosphatase [Streptomyces sp. NBC_00259]|uniref:PP2C family protein-serine/threonine phosphatase n=1 Tax=Streptomyces sp. NBC_00259 TaxID=2903643 RepID=UPI002E27C610|nr:SpoIIE family protein phosphatase [Streptomyces sp. NBC_00259]
MLLARVSPSDLRTDADHVTILLVEDDDGDALLVEETLRDSGLTARPTRARSMAEARVALSGAHGAPAQCVLLDLHLPDAQGLDVVGQVLAVAPGAAVVVLTGLAEEGVGLSAVAAGAQDYLIKGVFEPTVLERSIRYAVQRRQIEHAAVALEASRMRARENARLERGLLPSPLLHGDAVDVVSRYEPSRSLGLLSGDFYDVVETADGTVHAVIGDVSGHGPDEAALGVCLRVAWRSFTLAGVSGTGVCELMQKVLVAERTGSEIFATVTTVELPPGLTKAKVVRAGHPPLLLRGPAGVRLVETAAGPALGLLPDGMGLWREDHLDLPAAGALALFTDGLFEGRISADGRRLGEDGLLALAGRHAGHRAEEFVTALIAETRALSAEHGGHSDDVALLHLEWNTQT